MLDTEQKARLVALLPHVSHLDAMQLARVYNETHRPAPPDRINWHDTAPYLDQLRTKGLLVTDHSRRWYDGMTLYKLNR